MGLFNLKNKKEAKAKAKAEAEAKARAEAEAKAAAEAAAARERALQRKREAEEAELAKKRELKQEQTKKENKILESSTAKKKQIERLEKAIERFEKEREEIGKLAIAANKAKKKTEAARHVTKAKRLKDRIDNYSNQLRLLQEQLFALEDTGANINYITDMKETTKVLEEVKVDVDEVEDALQDAREGLDAAKEVQNAIKGDVSMFGEQEDTDDLLAELEEEFGDEVDTGKEPVVDIPDVPSLNPTPPTRVGKAPATAAPSVAVDEDDDEIRKLEADIAGI